MHKQNLLVSEDIFPKTLKINLSNIFPVAVVATVSSGKSTLINALLGRDILPNSNTACTSRSIFILDDDRPSNETIYVTDMSGETIAISDNITKALDKLNRDPNVQNIFIRSHVGEILNTGKALLLIDTPGPNNSKDMHHKETLVTLLDKLHGGLVIYVLNATQLGINDDKNLLELVKTYIENTPDLNILFVLNKIDLLDEDRESITDYVNEAIDYLKATGYKNPEIIPASASAAVLFQKVLRRQKMTRKEIFDLKNMYSIYQPTDFNMNRFCVTKYYPNQYDKIRAIETDITVGQIRQALSNTGIKCIEEYIQQAQILSEKRLKNTIRIIAMD